MKLIPSNKLSRDYGLSSVHGQPVFPGGGGGSSFNVGQRIGTPQTTDGGRWAMAERR